MSLLNWIFNYKYKSIYTHFTHTNISMHRLFFARIFHSIRMKYGTTKWKAQHLRLDIHHHVFIFMGPFFDNLNWYFKLFDPYCMLLLAISNVFIEFCHGEVFTFSFARWFLLRFFPFMLIKYIFHSLRIFRCCFWNLDTLRL